MGALYKVYWSYGSYYFNIQASNILSTYIFWDVNYSLYEIYDVNRCVQMIKKKDILEHI